MTNTKDIRIYIIVWSIFSKSQNKPLLVLSSRRVKITKTQIFIWSKWGEKPRRNSKPKNSKGRNVNNMRRERNGAWKELPKWTALSVGKMLQPKILISLHVPIACINPVPKWQNGITKKNVCNVKDNWQKIIINLASDVLKLFVLIKSDMFKLFLFNLYKRVERSKF